MQQSRAYIRQDIECMYDQLIGTTRDKDNKLLVVDAEIILTLTSSINISENNFSHSYGRMKKAKKKRI